MGVPLIGRSVVLSILKLVGTCVGLVDSRGYLDTNMLVSKTRNAHAGG